MEQNANYHDGKFAMRTKRNGKPLNTPKEQISPWSFYKERQQTMLSSIEKRNQQQSNKKREIDNITPSFVDSSNNSKDHTTKQILQNQISEQEDKHQQLINLSKDVKDMIRQRVFLRIISKYMEVSESNHRLETSTQTVVTNPSNLQISQNTNLPEESRIRQNSKLNQEKAFNDKRLQIHTIPPELRLARIRKSSLVTITSRKYMNLQNEQSQQIGVVGQNKPVINK